MNWLWLFQSINRPPITGYKIIFLNSAILNTMWLIVAYDLYFLSTPVVNFTVSQLTGLVNTHIDQSFANLVWRSQISVRFYLTVHNMAFMLYVLVILSYIFMPNIFMSEIIKQKLYNIFSLRLTVPSVMLVNLAWQFFYLLLKQKDYRFRNVMCTFLEI